MAARYMSTAVRHSDAVAQNTELFRIRRGGGGVVVTANNEPFTAPH